MSRVPTSAQLEAQCSAVSNRTSRLGLGLEKLGFGDENGRLTELADALRDFVEALGRLHDQLSGVSVFGSEPRLRLSSLLSEAEDLVSGALFCLERARSDSHPDSATRNLEALLSTTEIWRLHLQVLTAFEEVITIQDTRDQSQVLLANEPNFEDIERLMAEFRLSQPNDPSAGGGDLPNDQATTYNVPEKGGILPDYDSVVSSPPSTHTSSYYQASAVTANDAAVPPPRPDDRVQPAFSSSKSSKSGGAGQFGGIGELFRSLTASFNKPEPLVAPLCHAAANGSIPQIRGLLSEGANINGLSEEGLTPLIVAILAGQLDTVDFLVKTGGAKLTTKDSTKSLPPLYHAAEAEQFEIMKLLLEQGADPKARTGGGSPIFVDAVGNLSTTAVRFLLEGGADAHAIDAGGKRAIVNAVQKERLDVVQLLLDHGAKVSSMHVSGQSLLGIAVQSGNLDMARLLIERGANVESRSASGGAPVAVATSRRDVDMLRLLLGNGASGNGRDGKGQLALVNAMTKDHLEIVRLLLEHGADAKGRDLTGRSVLLLAVTRDKLESARLLLDHGASHNISDLSGTSLLSVVLKLPFPEERVAEHLTLLLRHGLDPYNKKTKFKDVPAMPLGTCIKNDMPILARVLIKEGGADPHRVAAVSDCHATPDTPFKYAIANRKKAVVKAMLDSGASIAVRNGLISARDMLVWAVTADSVEMVDMLVNAGIGDFEVALTMARDMERAGLSKELEGRIEESAFEPQREGVGGMTPAYSG